MPPQLMTMSAAICPVSPPASQSTPVTRLPSSVTAVTLTPSMICAPASARPWPAPWRCWRVALAVAGQVHGAGDVADLHMGIHRLDLGGRDLAHVHVEGAGERGLAQSSSRRSAVSPREIEPTCRMPVATPVSSSSLT
jgi:hypothetical protein